MKVLVTDKINESAGKIIEGVAQVDFLPTMSEDELIQKEKDMEKKQPQVISICCMNSYVLYNNSLRNVKVLRSRGRK